MMKSNRLFEWIARGFVAGLLIGLFGAVYLAHARGQQGIIDLHAVVSESGGWTPADLTARVGEPLRLRLTSDDVVHGFAVAQTGQEEIELLPGKPVETTLTFDQPGRYTYYCTRWCGLNHWRMRGVIDVTGKDPAGNTIPIAEPPLYQRLGIDLDAPHPAAVTPQAQPSAERGDQLGIDLPASYLGPDYYRANSPAQAWQALRQEPSLAALDDQAIWDLVAKLWLRQTTPAGLQSAAGLYARNCAACHGETGQGNGVMAEKLAAASIGAQMSGDPAMPGNATNGSISGQSTIRPVDFTDPSRMLGASPALLEGKIVRGGMGTGMPYWGPIFTEDQIREIVSYLYTFQFKP